MDRNVTRLRLLIVDDNREAATTLAEIFQLLESFDVSFVLTPTQAIADALQSPPDIVISDICMPRMDGCELASELLTITGETTGTRPLMVAITAMGEVQLRCSEAGFDHFFQKPVSAKALIQLLQEYAETVGLHSPTPRGSIDLLVG